MLFSWREVNEDYQETNRPTSWVLIGRKGYKRYKEWFYNKSMKYVCLKIEILLNILDTSNVKTAITRVRT